MEQEISSCRQTRCNQLSLSDDEKSGESSITHQSPSLGEINNLGSKKNEPKMIVLAFCAPIQMTKNKKPKNHLNHRKKERTPSAAVSVFKFPDLCCCCDYIIAEKLKRLKLSGCAVIPKGVLVVEGEISSIKRFSRFIHQKNDRRCSDYRLKVIWEGKVSRRSFGKFSILRRCSSEFAVSKFFTDHGASHYWDLVISDS